jgi:capsule polysaccharide export protein KpsE/RkpR
MTPRPSLTGRLANMGAFSRVWKRALIFGIPATVLLVASAYPEQFRAEATLTPADPSTLGLSDTLGQLGALNSVFGKQADVEIALRIGTSVYTRKKVIDELKLEERLDMHELEVHRWLDDKLVMRSLRGGIILVQMDDTDRQLAEDIVGALTEATREQLATITMRQTNYKREVLEKLVADAGLRLSKALSEFDGFRLSSGYADPGPSIESIGARVPGLRGQIEDIDRRIAAASRLFAPENIQIIQLQAERDALQQQLREALGSQPSPQSGTVGEAVNVSTRIYELERELNLARSLYNNYLRYLQGTTVEELTSTANIRLLELPFITTERQYRWPLVAGALALLLLWMAIEFYRLRPPLGAPMAISTTRSENGMAEAAE